MRLYTGNQNLLKRFVAHKSISQHHIALRLFSTSRIKCSLVSTIPKNTLDSIASLPEVSDVLLKIKSKNSPSSSHIEGLDRSSEIFQQINPNGEEYKAVQILRVQVLSQLYQFDQAIQAIDEIQEKCILNDEETFQISLAKTKSLFYTGSFDKAIEISTNLCDFVPQMTGNDSTHVQLRQGIALNAQALCRLVNIGLKDEQVAMAQKEEYNQEISSKLGEATEIQEICAMASKILERNAEMGSNLHLNLACAASYSNQGIAELTTSLVQSKSMQHLVPMDSAMKSWRRALSILEDIEREPTVLNALGHEEIMFMKSTKARTYANMTWALLFSDAYASTGKSSVNEETLKLASEYAGLALKINDEIENADQNLGRILTLVASCYARAGSAVTAEGLFQSSMDILEENTLNPFITLDARSAYLNYSNLCKNWEKRSADAKKYKQLALKYDDSLIGSSWHGICSLYSGLHLFGTLEL